MSDLRLTLAAAAAFATLATASPADDAMIARGEYLVAVSGCNDCHTPGYFLGKPDFSRALSGSEVGFEVPGLGTFYGPNLTSDPETGLGLWSQEDIVAAFTTGVRPDGRSLAPVMPWMAYSRFTPEDAAAIAAYLSALAPIRNRVPGPLGPDEPSPAFVMRIIPPGG